MGRIKHAWAYREWDYLLDFTVVMPIYAMDTIPLINNIKEEVKQDAFNRTNLEHGGTTCDPLLGYYPSPDKSRLNVKPDLFQTAIAIFRRN